MFGGLCRFVLVFCFMLPLAAGGTAMAQSCGPACNSCGSPGNFSGGAGVWTVDSSWKSGFGEPDFRCAPVLEDTPHWNLYWFQCASVIENCDEIIPTLMSQQPNWYAGAEFVPLIRSGQGSRPFARFGADHPDAGTVALHSNEFDDEFAGGGRFFLGKQFGAWHRFEVAYLGAYNFDDDAAVRDNTVNTPGGTGTLASPFTDFGNPETQGLDFNELAQISFESDFHSLEFHMRRKIAIPTHGVEASFLLGGRYMQIDENFAYRTVANVPAAQGAINDVAVAAENKLIGIQIGTLLQFYQTPRAWIDLDLKGGIFQNLAEQRSVYTNVDNNGAATVATTSDDEMRTSFAGEILLAANYNFSRTFTLRMGYQATAITGLALAEENFQDNLSLLSLGPGQLDHDGTAVYHGPVIGVTWVR